MRVVELLTAINIALKMMNDHIDDPKKRICELEFQMIAEMEDKCLTIKEPETGQK